MDDDSDRVEKNASGRAPDVDARRVGETERLAAIVEGSEDAIVGKTTEGVIVDWNRGAELLYGYTAGEAIGQSISMLFPPEIAAREAQLTVRAARGERIEHYETLRVRKDGHVVSVSLTLSPFRDATGAIVGVSAIARDLTAREVAQEVIQRAQLLDLAHDAVIVREPAGSRITYWNHEAEELYGYTAERARGRVSHELLATVFPQSSEAVDAVLLERGRWEGD